ncbi:uncharacterized protein HGUI_00886 [Hanseniaspora guilliermondii]|uniref:E3 SUMO-protein ligase SIZ1 n=1 Tax=Hanseniaspora guilliermondii TaxID=56406 RepID=A0A1L0FGH1_9ASCO|nr:uncharacterized protein HGUI_00886 [Hanseniaspora guilliermondii]
MQYFTDEHCFDVVFNIEFQSNGIYNVPRTDEYIEMLNECRVVELKRVCEAIGIKSKGRKQEVIEKVDRLIQNSDNHIETTKLSSLCFIIRALMNAAIGAKRYSEDVYITMIPSARDLQNVLNALQGTVPMKVIVFLATLYYNGGFPPFNIDNIPMYGNLKFLEQAKIQHLRLTRYGFFEKYSAHSKHYLNFMEDSHEFAVFKIPSLNHIYTNPNVPHRYYYEPFPSLELDPSINTHKYANMPGPLPNEDKQFLREQRGDRHVAHSWGSSSVYKTNNSSSTNTLKKPTSSLLQSPDTKKMMDEYKFIQSYFFMNTKLLKQGILPKTGYKTTTLLKFQLTEADIQRLEATSAGKGYSYDVLLYCGSFTNTIQPREFVKFPSPIEIKINNVHITDYIRGIKDKPETAQAARLTEHLILDTQKENVVQITFIRTLTPFVCKVYLAKSFDGLQLFKKSISIKEHIPKNVTIRKVQEILQEDDDEVQMETMKMSLQCPISYMKMKYPIRSLSCHHIQCFDAQWFLEAQKQVPLWECPVCQKKVNIMDLRICNYTMEILENCKNDYDDQVEITKDGNYKYIEGEKDMSDSEDDEPNASKSNTVDSYKFQTTKKNELEPEIINLISDDEEVTNNNSTILPQLSVPVPLSIPVLTTAESEEHIGNIADDDEMPSLRNDGRDLTITLARHHLSPALNSQVTPTGNPSPSIEPNNSPMPQKRKASVQQQPNDFVDLTSD